MTSTRILDILKLTRGYGSMSNEYVAGKIEEAVEACVPPDMDCHPMADAHTAGIVLARNAVLNVVRVNLRSLFRGESEIDNLRARLEVVKAERDAMHEVCECVRVFLSPDDSELIGINQGPEADALLCAIRALDEVKR